MWERAVALGRRQARLAAIMGWTSGVVSGARVLEPWADDAYRNNERFKMRWVHGMERICGLEVHLAAGLARPAKGPRLVVSNHRTPLDILALLSQFGGHFLANHKVATAPIIGEGARRIGTVFVERDNAESGIAAIRAMRRLLKEGHTMIVFPEGTTFGGDEVRPFKGGAFTAASGMEVEVVPVGLAYTPGHEFVSGSLGDHIRSYLGRPGTPVWMAIGEGVMLPRHHRTFHETIHGEVQKLVHRARRAADIDMGLESDRRAGASSMMGAR